MNSRIDSKRSTLRYIIIKLSKDNLESSKKETNYVQESLRMINIYYLIKKYGSRKQEADIFKGLKKRTKNSISSKTIP